MLGTKIFFEICFFLQDLAIYFSNIFEVECKCKDNSEQCKYDQNHLYEVLITLKFDCKR